MQLFLSLAANVKSGSGAEFQITVDGDTSTNDTLLALANGQSRTPAITEMGQKRKSWRRC